LIPKEKPLRVTVWGLFTVLVLLGVFRRELPDAIREVWVPLVVLVAVVAALFNLVRIKCNTDSDSNRHVLSAMFFIVLAGTYLQPQRVASDGVFYFTPLHSIVVDGDVDFENEYRVLGAEDGYFHRTETGRLPNNFSIGPALLWAPFYLVVHAVGLLGAFRPTGFGYPYFTAIATTTAVGGFLGVLWFYRLAGEYFERNTAFIATVLLWLGSFHLWYMVFEPSMSHALAMAAVTAYLLLCQRGLTGRWGFVIAGIAAGLVMLIRWQNVIFLPVGLIVIWRKQGRPRWDELAAGVLAAVVMFVPQMVYWKLLYGRFLLIPQGGGYMQWGSPQFLSVLFASRHGLLSWSPLLWLGALGFIGVVKKAPALGWSLLGAFLASLYVNASVYDWWAGASFGARRFDGALPAFGLGLAAAVAWALPWIRKHAAAVFFIMAVPFLVWNVLLMGLYSTGSIPFDGAVSFQQAGSDGLEMIYRKTGYPFSWPGALIEKIRNGRPAPIYDLSGAQHPSNNVDIRMGNTDALYLGRGWSLLKRGRGPLHRNGSSEGAFLYVALRDPAPYRLIVEGHSTSTVVIAVNRKTVGEVTLHEGEPAEVEIPTARVVSGINEVVFSSRIASSYSISRVRLERPGDH
jgi:hypothetical protein